MTPETFSGGAVGRRSRVRSARATRGDGYVALLNFPALTDPRGNLAFGQFPEHLPFCPKRFFVTYGVPLDSVRGEHAHKQNEQVIVCVHGALTVAVDNGDTQEEFVLNSPEMGLYIPAGVWASQKRHSAGCVMLVLASEGYDEDGYIRKYSDFLAYIQKGNVVLK